MTMPKPPRLSHLVIRVRDLERSEGFYTQVLGLKVSGRLPGAMTFFTDDGDESHTLAIMNVGADAPRPDPSRVGLYDFAYQVESMEELRVFYHHLKESVVRIVGMGDHGIPKGVYFLDPDGNEIEVFYELPRSQWPDPEQPFADVTVKPFSLE